MYEMAKKAREAMKGKARKLAAEKDQKVDSSDWSPAEPLNADVKTGLRPISRRAYKKGGKVEGEACGPMHMGRKARKSGGKVESEKAEATEYAKAKINRNVKAANEEREGVKHVGGLKSGGRAKKQDGGLTRKLIDQYNEMNDREAQAASEKKLKTPMGEIERRAGNAARTGVIDDSGPKGPTRRKSGGRAKKMDGGTLDKMVDPEMRDQIERGSKTPAEMPKNPPMPPRRPAEPVGGKGTEPVGLDADQVKRLEEGRKYGGRSARKDGGKIATTLADQEKIQKEQADASKPHRGKAGHYKDGGSMPLPETGERRPPARNMIQQRAYGASDARNSRLTRDALESLKNTVADDTPMMKKGGRAKKMMGGPMADPRMDIVKKKAMDFGSGAQGTPYKKGGRIERKAGGRAKGKTNINIVIAAGKPAGQDMMQPPLGSPPMPPPGVPVPLPGGGAPGGMPMGAPMGGGMPLPPPPAPPAMPGAPAMGRKAGGRVTKIAKSYKDMEAGSGGGEGRLQKTDIAKTGKGAPTFRRGGKVYRSYKDMDAGSGSGLGRIEKTEIQARKG